MEVYRANAGSIVSAAKAALYFLAASPIQATWLLICHTPPPHSVHRMAVKFSAPLSSRLIGVLALMIWLFAALAALGVLAMVMRHDLSQSLLVIACAGAAVAFVVMGVVALVGTGSEESVPRAPAGANVEASIEARRQVSWMLEDASDSLREVARSAVHEIRRQVQSALHEQHLHDADPAMQSLRSDFRRLEQRVAMLAQALEAERMRAYNQPPARSHAVGEPGPEPRSGSTAHPGPESHTSRGMLDEGVTVVRR